MHGTVVTTVVGLPLESVVVMWETTSVSTLPLDLVTTVVWSISKEPVRVENIELPVLVIPSSPTDGKYETTKVSVVDGFVTTSVAIEG